MSNFNGQLKGLLQWAQLNTLQETLLSNNDGGWHVYYVGEAVPSETLSSEQFIQVVKEIVALLRRDHHEDYLGIVYVDDMDEPGFIKIYDPNNLGSSCGSCGIKVLPGWTISRSAPVELEVEVANPGGRRRWWTGLFS